MPSLIPSLPDARSAPFTVCEPATDVPSCPLSARKAPHWALCVSEPSRLHRAQILLRLLELKVIRIIFYTTRSCTDVPTLFSRRILATRGRFRVVLFGRSFQTLSWPAGMSRTSSLPPYEMNLVL